MSSPTHRSRKRFALAISIVGWLVLVSVGFNVTLSYQSRPGASTETLSGWPAEVPIAPSAELFTLLLFAHPRCPCTRATLEELDRLIARCGTKLEAHVFFYSDPALGAGWERSHLWQRAAAIPGVAVHADPLGACAARFAAQVSGQTLLFAPGGDPTFRGGITSGRGHIGDNPGSVAIQALVSGDTPAASSTPVFGCELLGSCEAQL